MLTRENRAYWIIEWLKRQGTAEWHGYVERHQWDGGTTAPLDWIVAQPDCDAGTAATIFWMGEPDYYLDGANDDHEVARLILEIARRWGGEGFSQGRFASDEGSHALIERINAGPHSVPPSLADPVEGHEPFPLLDDLPAEIDIAWHRANGREPPAHLLQPKASPLVAVQRRGKMSAEEVSRVWARLGPTSAFSAIPSRGKGRNLVAGG